MARSIKLLGAIALAVTAACSTDPISPSNVAATRNANASAASTNNIVVTESDIAREQEDLPPTRSWVFYYRLVATSTGTFITGPGNPPLGVGSFEMSTPTNADKGTLFNYDHIGTRIADIRAISYATYRNQPATGGVALPSINIEIDKDGGAFLPGDYMSLVYEPYINGASIQDGIWQTWNTIPGIWWATRPITRPDLSVCLPQVCTLSWSDIVAAMPNATILGGFGVNQGSFSGGLVASTDALTIAYGGSTWVYNFEPFRSPTSKDDCKDGGWETLKAADGSSFKNQGQCIKYVNEISNHS